MNNRFVVTGGPGGGKTTILGALTQRGYSFAPESARSIIKRRLATGQSPRPDPVSFAREILNSDMEKYREMSACNRVVFFDRGVLDALYMLDAEGALTRNEIAQYVQEFPYSGVVFLLPPWKEIYDTDSERDQSFAEAEEVFAGMKQWYTQWGYETLEVPRVTIDERVSFIAKAVDQSLTCHNR